MIWEEIESFLQNKTRLAFFHLLVVWITLIEDIPVTHWLKWADRGSRTLCEVLRMSGLCSSPSRASTIKFGHVCPPAASEPSEILNVNQVKIFRHAEGSCNLLLCQLQAGKAGGRGQHGMKYVSEGFIELWVYNLDILSDCPVSENCHQVFRFTRTTITGFELKSAIRYFSVWSFIDNRYKVHLWLNNRFSVGHLIVFCYFMEFGFLSWTPQLLCKNYFLVHLNVI